jgi:hypothetical protein
MPTRKDYVDLLQQKKNKFRPADFAIQEGTSVTDIKYGFLGTFLDWRLWAERYMLVTSAYRKNDPRAHGYGLALDIILFNKWLQEITSPKEQWLKATTWPFKGVGIYFDWHYRDKSGERQKAVGLHVDRFYESRPLRWLRITKEVSINGNEIKPHRLYYYQDPKTGLFYNNDIKETVSLNEVIETWEESK